MAPFTDEQRVLAANDVLSGRSATSVAGEIGVMPSTVLQWVRRVKSGAAFDLRKYNGKKAVLTDEDMALVEQWVSEDPYRSAPSICEALSTGRERAITPAMLRLAMRKRGIKHVRPVLEGAVPVQPQRQTRYRPEHRREPAGEQYPSSLTDAEWAVLRPIFAVAASGRGRPFTTDPRETLDAIFYVLRSGCSWRMLPAHYPGWKSVYTNFRAWSRGGRMDLVYDALVAMWRTRIGRDAEPTATIIDSQTVKTTEKGGLEVTTEPRRSTDGSGTSP